MSRRSPQLRALLRAAEPTREIPPDVRARSAKRVAKLAALPLAVSVWSVWGKVVFAAVLVGAVVTARAVLVRETPPTPIAASRRLAVTPTSTRPTLPATPPVVRTLEAPALVPPRPARAPTPTIARRAPPAATPTVAEVVTPAVTHDTPVEPLRSTTNLTGGAGVVAPSRPVEDELLGELRLVGEAQSALSRDPEAVLAITARHRAEFPHGRLLEESEFLSLDALHRLGRREALALRAEDFLRAHPRGPYAERVRRWVDASHRGE
jgi:hypothetical protein